MDKEEIGSVGATGMHSRFFENMVAEVMDRCGDYSELKLRRALANSYMLSSDVSAAYDPNYASVFEKKNSAFFGKGMVFNKYTGSRGKSGSNDASAEFIGKLRKVMDDADVYFQMAELGKVRNVQECQMAINNLLEKIGHFTKADRAYIVDEKDGFYYNTYEWCNEGIEPQIK